VEKIYNSGIKYIVTKTNIGTFQERLMQAFVQVARDTMKEDDRANKLHENRVKKTTNIEPRVIGKEADEVDTLDEMLRHRVVMMPKIEAAVDELHEIMDQACRTSFRQAGKKGQDLKHKSIPRWSSRLTIQRKEVNVKRRRYQRTKDNSGLRGQRKDLYLSSKAEYAAAIRQEKSKSWKEFCSLTSATNPWSAIYKRAAGKMHRAANITTLRQHDGSHTTHLQNTLRIMVHKFAPDDNPEDDEEIYRQTKAMTREPIDTEDDVEFTTQEVKNAVQDLGDKMAPGGDGIPNEVWKGVVTILTKYLTVIYYGCLKEGVFPNR
jgi:hypothetical protein